MPTSLTGRNSIGSQINETLKTPGPDGMHATFFQQFWPLVKQEVCDHIFVLFMGTKDIRDFTHTFLHLILKKQQTQTPAKLLSITLCNVSYKILTKFLILRLKPILPHMILEMHSGFSWDEDLQIMRLWFLKPYIQSFQVTLV